MFCPAEDRIIIITTISLPGDTVTKSNHRIIVFGSVCVCVCVRERERESDDSLQYQVCVISISTYMIGSLHSHSVKRKLTSASFYKEVSYQLPIKNKSGT